MRRLVWVVATVLIAAGVPACAPAPSASNLTLFAAASLSDAVDAATAEYNAGHPEVTFNVSTGSSTALRTQIEQGAAADILLSADTRNPQALFDGGLADGAPTNFASNSLVIVVPKGNPAGVTSPFDLARPGLRIVAAGDAVPITRYVSMLLANLAGMANSPPNFADDYAANVVSREEDVRSTLAKVELGEADAAVVYVTDARSSDKVDTIAVPEEAQVKAQYAAAVMKASKSSAAAHAFLDWLESPAGQPILFGFGFGAP